MVEERDTYRNLVGKTEGKRPLGRRRCRWEDNIKMDHKRIGTSGMGWIDLAQDGDQWRALVKTVIYRRVP
jgi:transposase